MVVMHFCSKWLHSVCPDCLKCKPRLIKCSKLFGKTTLCLGRGISFRDPAVVDRIIQHAIQLASLQSTQHYIQAQNPPGAAIAKCTPLRPHPLPSLPKLDAAKLRAAPVVLNDPSHRLWRQGRGRRHRPQACRTLRDLCPFRK